MARFSRRGADWLVLLCVDLAVPATLAWKRHDADVTVNVAILAAIIVLAGMNALFLLAFLRRDKRQAVPTSRLFIFGAIGAATLSLLVTLAAVASMPAQDNDLRLALSDTPLENIEPGRKRIFAELLRRMAADTREENLALDEARKNPISPALYSPESFANLVVIQGTSAKIQKYAQIDFDYNQKLHQDWADFSGKMASADPAYLDSLNKSEKEKRDIEAKTIDIEKQWLSSVVSLYDFAAKHSAAIKLQNGGLSFSEAGLKEDFERQRDLSKALLDKVNALENELVLRKQKAQKDTGIIVP